MKKSEVWAGFFLRLGIGVSLYPIGLWIWDRNRHDPKWLAIAICGPSYHAFFAFRDVWRYYNPEKGEAEEEV